MEEKRETLKVCRHCNNMLMPGNVVLADGCPCNSPRGVNHGLVAKEVCTCDFCDPAQTGASRATLPAKPEVPAVVAKKMWLVLTHVRASELEDALNAHAENGYQVHKLELSDVFYNVVFCEPTLIGKKSAESLTAMLTGLKLPGA